MEKPKLVEIGKAVNGERGGDGSPDARFAASMLEGTLALAASAELWPDVRIYLSQYADELSAALDAGAQHG